MTFRTVYQDEFTQMDVADTFNQLYEYITPSLHAYNVCIHLNLLYKRIHSIWKMPIYYSSCISKPGEHVLSVLFFNLSYELNCLEKIKEENEHVFKKEYRHCFETAIEELKGLKNVIDQDHTIEPNYIITMVDFLNKLILRGFTELTKTYPEHGFYIKY